MNELCKNHSDVDFEDEMIQGLVYDVNFIPLWEWMGRYCVTLC